jgi:hypothetical protein
MELNRMRLCCARLAMLALVACGRANDRKVSANQTEAVPVSNQVRPIVPAPGTGPDARTPLAPVRPAIDPKSTEAAVQLVRGFVQLLNQRKFDDAYMLLGPNAPPRRAFDHDFARLSDLEVRQGAAGDQDGAAGSIYLSVPLTVSGTADGKRVRRSAEAVLRRVNDVPGSTEAQRHWHIERIDWTGD